MKKNLYSLVLILILLVIVFALQGFGPWKNKISSTLTSTTTSQHSQNVKKAFTTTTYENKMNKFSFSYPSVFDVLEYTSDSISVGKKITDGIESALDISILGSDPQDKKETYETFYKSRLENFCAADGPLYSIYCDRITSRASFKTAAGVEGEVVYLRRVKETLATKEKSYSTYGPFFIFNISGTSPVFKYQSLFLYPPAALRPEQVSSQFITSVAKTLVFTTNATSSATGTSSKK
ncbi:MAG: hypothetical protein RL094_816 [Candidatus Parcubacteria bacterium]|jgi:hypothetical protein